MKDFNNIEDLKRDNKAGFTVPDGYFENLPSIIQQRCVESQKSSINEIVRVSILTLIKPYLLMGSFMITLLIGIYTVNTFIVPSDNNIVSPGMAENGNFNLDELASQFSENDLAFFVEESALTNIVDNENSGEIADYLINENIDYSTLIEGCK